ncbi:IclR family transcriptional regulator [Pandoraea terrae]|uniref:IclR family transcriptional regulator n=1 Tax=Pandoraea terrae TaxID=1537710 RepID=A0A5E4RV93_9BURK|nr:IclR family transcriptional regulator [Pandoraea terrae]VVD66731.1 IclR family transcriptional regulator [Pandoraea terrae]
MSNDNDNKYSVPGLERGLRILMAFSAREPVLNGADLARRLDIPRSTVFRLLQTLESEGFIEKAGDERNYRLGVAVLRLGFEYLNSLELTDLGTPVIEKLRDQTGFSSHILILDQRDAVFVAKAASRELVFGSVRVGTRLPAHATAVGHMLLGDYSLDALRKLYPERKLDAFTTYTPTTVEALYKVVQEDVARGYSMSQAFFEQNISTIAAPVRNHLGEIAAVISVTIPQARVEADLLASGLVETVVNAADELSHKLNYRANPRSSSASPAASTAR